MFECCFFAQMLAMRGDPAGSPILLQVPDLCLVYKSPNSKYKDQVFDGSRLLPASLKFAKLKAGTNCLGSSIHLLEFGLQRQQAKKSIPDVPLPSNAFQFLLRDREVISFCLILSLSWAFSQTDVPGKGSYFSRHLNQMPKPLQLVLFTPVIHNNACR